MSKRILFTFGIAALATCFAQAQQPSAGANSMPGMDMSSHDQSAPPAQNTAGSMKDMPGMDASAADHTMESHHMDMGPHMKMTALRDPKPGDSERAAKVLESARGVMTKYQDYHTALNDGFQIFHPEIPQNMYHFTNYKYG
jgi:hypothetical protein